MEITTSTNDKSKKTNLDKSKDRLEFNTDKVFDPEVVQYNALSFILSRKNVYKRGDFKQLPFCLSYTILWWSMLKDSRLGYLRTLENYFV